MNSIDRIVVIGAGAVGGTVGSLIAQTGVPVVFVARGKHGQAIQAKGLELSLFDQTIVSQPRHVTCVDRISDVDWTEGDVVVAATKLNDAENVMDELLSSAGKQIPVVCSSNGIVGEAWATARFANVISMLVWLPATHLVPGKVSLHSESVRGVLDIGAAPARLKSSRSEDLDLILSELAGLLVSCGFESEVRNDIMDWKHAKWITNLGNSAQAMVDGDWKAVAQAAQHEGVTVLKAASRYTISKEQLLERCDRVVIASASHMQREGGSTWQSLKRGKPLESRYLEGGIADLANEIGISAPINRFLANVSLEPRRLTVKEVLECQE